MQLKEGWLTITGRIKENNKYKYSGYCDCGKEFINVCYYKKILAGTSKSFDCNTCFLSNYTFEDNSWEWIEGFQGYYAVSSQGNVKNIRSGKILKPNTYGSVQLGKGGPTRQVKKLVAKAFVKNPEGLKYIKFLDGNERNFKAENLQWSYVDYVDLTGEVFGRLTVKNIVRTPEENVTIRWLCECECGNSTIVTTSGLNGGSTKSCGCLAMETRTKHGQCGSITYVSWQSAKRRVTNENLEGWKNYGGRGIGMSEEWFNDFSKFLEDMGERPSLDYSLERIDVNGDYCKENCKWATEEEQAYNKRRFSSNTSGRTGVYWCKMLGKWKVVFAGKHQMVTDSFEEACEHRTKLELEFLNYVKE